MTFHDTMWQGNAMTYRSDNTKRLIIHTHTTQVTYMLRCETSELISPTSVRRKKVKHDDMRLRECACMCVCVCARRVSSTVPASTNSNCEKPPAKLFISSVACLLSRIPVQSKNQQHYQKKKQLVVVVYNSRSNRIVVTVTVVTWTETEIASDNQGIRCEETEYLFFRLVVLPALTWPLYHESKQSAYQMMSTTHLQRKFLEISWWVVVSGNVSTKCQICR